MNQEEPSLREVDVDANLLVLFVVEHLHRMTDVGGFIRIEAKANVRLAGCHPVSFSGVDL